MTHWLLALLTLFAPVDLQSERASINIMLNGWHRAAWLADEGAYFSCFSGDDAVFMGTDATERWTAAEFREWARPYFERGRAWEFFAEGERNIAFNDDADTAWFDETLVTPNMGPCRGTGVLVKQNEQWKIAHYNLSIPIPNAIVDGVVERTAMELLGEQGIYTPRAGDWHAWLDTPGGPLPFNIVFQHDAGTLVPYLVNGEEGYTRVPRFELNRQTHEVVLGFDHYDSVIRAEIDMLGLRMHGTWTKRRGPDEWASIPFHASAGTQPLFADDQRVPIEHERPFHLRQPVHFEGADETAIFEAREVYPTILTATFETPTGDYRYLSGNLYGDSIKLSVFDGAHAFLFHIERHDDGRLAGEFWSGDWWRDTFISAPDDTIMPVAWDMTLAPEHVAWGAYTFPDTEGAMRSLDEHIDKPRIIYLFGTWCPNCTDATSWLGEVRREHPEIEIVGLAFEVTGDAERDTEQVRRYRDLHKIDWPLLLAGTSKKADASAALPFLSGVKAYPTIIFVRPGGMIEDIYTGFSGPATGASHERLVAEFRDKIQAILSK